MGYSPCRSIRSSFGQIHAAAGSSWVLPFELRVDRPGVAAFLSVIAAHSAETRSGSSACLSAVFAFTFVHTGGSNSALGVVRSVSIGIAPRIRFHAEVVTGVAGAR